MTVTKNKRFLGILLGIVALLLIPLIGMQFSSEINWSISDFLIAGALLSLVGGIFELIMRKVSSKNKRIGLVLILLVALFLIWVELAVGIFGTPIAGS